MLWLYVQLYVLLCVADYRLKVGAKMGGVHIFAVILSIWAIVDPPFVAYR